MLNSKQRATLRGMASKLDPVVQIGHKEISDNMLVQIDGVLETRELIKISILQNSDADPKIMGAELAGILNIGKNQIPKYLKELQDKGMIEIYEEIEI